MPGMLAAVGLAVALALILWVQRDTTTAAPSTATNRVDVAWPVQITARDGLDLHPALSPQGDAVAYVSDRTGAFEIYVRALSGTATDTPLTTDGSQNVQPTWSPDGHFVAYHSYRRGGIWVVPARGGVPRQIAASGSNPAWSPDGSRIAYQSDEHADVTPTAWLAQAGSTIWIVDADGANARQVTQLGNPVGGHASPAWNRDGRFLAFSVFEAGQDSGVWLLDVANKTDYPDDLFAASPNLPPCGTNTKAARTWVDIYDQSGKRLNGFCTLGKAADLNGIWFSLETGVIPPSWVYIEMNDRKTNTKYKSNLSDTTL